MKAHGKNEFHAKRAGGGCHAVIDGYDMSMESSEVSGEAAIAPVHRPDQPGNEGIRRVMKDALILFIGVAMMYSDNLGIIFLGAVVVTIAAVRILGKVFEK